MATNIARGRQMTGEQTLLEKLVYHRHERFEEFKQNLAVFAECVPNRVFAKDGVFPVRLTGLVNFYTQAGQTLFNASLIFFHDIQPFVFVELRKRIATLFGFN